ncbi:SpoIID/LytB domain-containing protein [bacterium]|nr:SpoIID/LytB domain-containing protein [bacterium]
MKKLVLVLLFAILIGPANAIEERRNIRVGLSDDKFATYSHLEATFYSKSNILITDMPNNKSLNLLVGDEITFKFNNGLIDVIIGGKTILEHAQGPFAMTSNTPISFKGVKRKGIQASYDGQMEVLLNPTKTGLNVVNSLDMNTYLKGVVPNEMPIYFGLEALKAQAVAARNYANRENKFKNTYDICDSVSCQVYFGANTKHELSNRAVDETESIYVLYDLEPALTLYHSTAGGITEDWEKVFLNNDTLLKPMKLHPYLLSKGKKLKSEKDVKKYYSKKPDSNDVLSPKYRWEYSWSEEELINSFNSRFGGEFKRKLLTPEWNEEKLISKIEDIKVLKRGHSGKALLLEVKTDIGTFKIKSEGAIRRVFSKNGSILPSANFFIEVEEEKIKDENDTIFTFADDLKQKTYKVIGGGFGHGVGMSQYGAYFMAKDGKNYSEILRYYYSNTTIGTLPRYINQWSDEVIPIYFDKKSMKKIIFRLDNTSGLKQFAFKINDLVFSPNMEQYHKKPLWFEISKYLKEGKNEIFVQKLSPEDTDKKCNYWLEIVGE